MNVATVALRELHRIHKQLDELRGRLARGPRQIKIWETNVAKLNGELESASEKAKQARMNVDRKQLDLKSGETKILETQGKLNTCNTNKEYQAFLDQIAAAEMANSVLADEILEGMEKIDEIDKSVEEAKKNVAVGNAELEKAREQVAATAESIQADIDRLEIDLQEAERQLPEDSKQEYYRVVKKRGVDSLAQVDGDVCEGCYQRITANMLNKLHLGQIVSCTSCSRLLYLPEDTAR